MLQSFLRNNGHVEHVQRRTRRSMKPPLLRKEPTVFTVMLMLGIVSAVGIASSFVVTGRDGYRRQPRETFAKTV